MKILIAYGEKGNNGKDWNWCDADEAESPGGSD